MAREIQTNVKQRAARIPLDYFKRKSALERWKGWLAGLAVVVGLAYVAWAAFGGSTVTKQFSPGPLAAAHAMWDNRCDACHQPFVPVGAGAWTSNSHASNALCQTCHQGAEHSPSQIASEVGSCASCHIDHRGRDADLTHVADSMCTDCHANLTNHLKPGAKPMDPELAKVTRFLDDHPEFRSAKRDPGQLKFSHSRHMRPGLTFGLNPMVLNDLSPGDRDRYRRLEQTDNDMVSLDCTSCHTLDRSDAKVAVSELGEGMSPSIIDAVRAAGDYMLPVRYEAHCQACHPLTYAGRMKLTPAASEAHSGLAGNAPPSAPARFQAVKAREVVPHGWRGDRLRNYVEQVLDMKFINDPDRDLLAAPLGDAARQPPAQWRLPNKSLQPAQPPQTVGEYLNEELQAALNNLRLQCIECHQMSDQPGSLDVQPLSTHPAWFAHAKFSHAAHRGVACQSCHGGAYPGELPADPTPIKTLDSDGVMIPGRQVCLDCHSPARGSGENARGGARFDCVECHRYHHGSETWHGIGASARGVPDKKKMSIEQFIRGGKSPR